MHKLHNLPVNTKQRLTFSAIGNYNICRIINFYMSGETSPSSAYNSGLFNFF